MFYFLLFYENGLLMDELKEKTCCFTGHRSINSAEVGKIREQLERVLIFLIRNGYVYFGAGGALGFDTIAAQTILKLQGDYPDIRLILVLPCEKQSEKWNKTDQIIYEDIKAKANKVVYTSMKYYAGCMYKRNRHLIDNSSMCICYLNKQYGGTAYTVDYAINNGLKIINIFDLI